MMTQQEIIKQIIAFPIFEQIEIIEEIQQNIKKICNCRMEKRNFPLMKNWQSSKVWTAR